MREVEMTVVRQVSMRLTPNRENVEWDPTRTIELADAKELAAKFLRHESQEVYAALLLDPVSKLIGYVELYRGSHVQVLAEPRELAKAALLANAYSVVLMHNHPGALGKVEVSDADIKSTRITVDALDMFSITVFDHLVVGEEDVESIMVAPSPTTAASVKRLLHPTTTSLNDILAAAIFGNR